MVSPKETRKYYSLNLSMMGRAGIVWKNQRQTRRPRWTIHTEYISKQNAVSAW